MDKFISVILAASMRSNPPLPLPVQRALAKLGQDIRSTRLRRRITTTTMAERAFITRPTLRKVERGDPGVSLGIYATILFVLGLTPHLADLADARTDDIGLQLEEERLPKRIRQPGTTRKKST
jgi:transcriptional regulator with XRE-family HTH domain